ncbi:MAG: mannonate dehydratase [Verrucomicrobiia bacterium]
MNRRDYLKGSLAAIGAAMMPLSPSLAASNPEPSAPAETKGGRIVLCELTRPGPLATTMVQMGLRHVIAGMRLQGTVEQQSEQVAKIKANYEAAGLKIVGVESAPVSFERMKLGLDGRDEEIQNFIHAVQALSQAGINMICYNWMAGIGWTRTDQRVPDRGGAITSEFDLKAAENLGETRFGKVSEEKVWDNLVYFQKAVIPVAEKFGVRMALHPDDPPISPLRGIGRILTSAENYRRVMDIVPSSVNGITFCQANFKLMGEDIHALAKEWCDQKKIFFVHLRDVEGTKEHFRETFHDNGPTDLARSLKIYGSCGYDLPLRPDHAPMMEGDTPGQTGGYGVTGKVLAFGYMMGLMRAQNIPYI